jgi:hypothetical protein
VFGARAIIASLIEMRFVMKQLVRAACSFAGVAVALACTAEPESSSTTAAPNVVQLSSANLSFQAPDTIDTGWTRFTFSSGDSDIHYAHIVQLDSGRSVNDLLTAYVEAIRTSGPRPKWIRRFGGPGGAAPGVGTANVIQHLEPGNYVWICPIEDAAGNPHFGKGEAKAFVVRAATSSSAQGASPVASTTIRLMDFTFTTDSALKAGRRTIRVENVGIEPHDLVMMKLAPGETLEDVRAFMNPEAARRPGAPPLPPQPPKSLENGTGGIAAIASGMHVFFEADLTPGDYILICMATAPDGRAHIEHGMIRQIRIE